jgi:DNA (cytosine-5)-methyltransferase 1
VASAGFELGINKAFQHKTRVQPERQVDVLQPRGDSTDSNLSLRNGRRSRPVCIGYSEIDKYAIKVYERHFKHENYGDATTINPTTLPDFDLLVGGFPCQAFSVAGKRAGFNDTRGTLFFDIARILKEKQPRHLVLENVKGLLSHDSGRTFTTILGVLSDLGYFVEWQVLNAKDFGVPQNRERVFIVGHLGGEPRRKVFPITGQSNKNTPVGKSTKTTVARALTAGGHSGGNHSGMTVIRQPLRFLDRNQKNIEGDYAFTVDASQTSGVKVEQRIRRLTPLECERLMAYPDNWTAGESDTQRYKMCGNGIVSNVVQAVMERLFQDTKSIKESDKE